MNASTIFFFFNDTATTEIYTLSLHDALPISVERRQPCRPRSFSPRSSPRRSSTSPARSCRPSSRDRKSTRLNSSHSQISYAVFCLKKKTDVFLSTEAGGEGRKLQFPRTVVNY